jgi:hypothetical protein
LAEERLARTSQCLATVVRRLFIAELLASHVNVASVWVRTDLRSTGQGPPQHPRLACFAEGSLAVAALAVLIPLLPQQTADSLRQPLVDAGWAWLSRPPGMLKLPAFAATPLVEKGAPWGRSDGLRPARSRCRRPPTPSWAGTSSPPPPGGSTAPRWPAWPPCSARHRPGRAFRFGAHRLVARPPRRIGAGDLEPGAGHPARRGRLVAPLRLDGGRPNPP